MMKDIVLIIGSSNLNRIDANLYGFFMAPKGEVTCQEEPAKKIATNIETAKEDQI